MAEDAAPEKPYGAYALLWTAGGMIIWGIGLGLSHIYGWLRYGAFPRYPVTDLFANIGLPYPSVSWVGVQNILDWLMACQAAYILFFAGMLLFWLAGSYTEDYRRRASDYRLKRPTSEARRWGPSKKGSGPAS